MKLKRMVDQESRTTEQIKTIFAKDEMCQVKYNWNIFLRTCKTDKYSHKVNGKLIVTPHIQFVEATLVFCFTVMAPLHLPVLVLKMNT